MTPESPLEPSLEPSMTIKSMQNILDDGDTGVLSKMVSRDGSNYKKLELYARAARNKKARDNQAIIGVFGILVSASILILAFISNLEVGEDITPTVKKILNGVFFGVASVFTLVVAIVTCCTTEILLKYDDSLLNMEHYKHVQPELMKTGNELRDTPNPTETQAVQSVVLDPTGRSITIYTGDPPGAATTIDFGF